MLFVSIDFLVFLAVVLVVYWSLNRVSHQNYFLMAASLFFYGYADWKFLSLIISSALAGYVSALAIEKSRKKKRFYLTLGIVFPFFLLFVFKYFNFFIDAVSSVTAMFGLSIFGKSTLSLVLPLGISFFTFQTVGYVIDVYRGHHKAEKNFPQFMLFISFFPQLVAGPIERSTHLLKQIKKNRTVDHQDLIYGAYLILQGFVKKLVVADNLAPIVNSLFAYRDLSGPLVAAGMIGFAFQIYGDFSGYTDIARGVARLMGFRLLVNFDRPYVSASPTEFWRRWHISLGTFFRDYIYIPLGGNRKNQIFNLFVVWFLTGFWHGASWNYILWGIYFGILVAVEKVFLLDFLKRIPKFLHHIYSLFFIIIGWALFYYTDLGQLTQFMKIIFGFTENPVWDLSVQTSLMSNIYWLFFAILVSMPIYPAIRDYMSTKLKSENTYSYVIIGFNLIFLLVSVALLVGKSYNPFLYFRF